MRVSNFVGCVSCSIPRVNGVPNSGMAQVPTEAPFSALVKVRSTGDPLGPVVFEKGTCRVEGEGLFGVAPGQSAVFYDETGTIRCGGVIA